MHEVVLVARHSLLHLPTGVTLHHSAHLHPAYPMGDAQFAVTGHAFYRSFKRYILLLLLLFALS